MLFVCFFVVVVGGQGYSCEIERKKGSTRHFLDYIFGFLVLQSRSSDIENPGCVVGLQFLGPPSLQIHSKCCIELCKTYKGWPESEKKPKGKLYSYV